MKKIKEILDKFYHETLRGQKRCPNCGKWAEFHQYLSSEESAYRCYHCHRFFAIER